MSRCFPDKVLPPPPPTYFPARLHTVIHAMDFGHRSPAVGGHGPHVAAGKRCSQDSPTPSPPPGRIHTRPLAHVTPPKQESALLRSVSLTYVEIFHPSEKRLTVNEESLPASRLLRAPTARSQACSNPVHFEGPGIQWLYRDAASDGIKPH